MLVKGLPHVDADQSSNNIDHLFTGKTLGAKSDIADCTLRGYEFRKFDNLVGDYYVAPAFLEAVAVRVHLASLNTRCPPPPPPPFCANFIKASSLE